MILQCPSCAARFLVADALVPSAGRTVKCGKCAHAWFIVPDPAALLAALQARSSGGDFAALTAQAYEEASPQPYDAKKLPVLPGKTMPAWPLQIAAAVLVVVWMVVALYAYFPRWHTSALSGIYAALGVTDTSDLVFADVSMEREVEGARTKFLLSGSIANHGAQPRLVPLVRVQIKDAEGEVIWGQNYPVGETIEPGAVYPFRIDNVQTSFANRASSIVLDIGNTFELVMR